MRRGRIREYVEQYPSAVYVPVDPQLDHNPIWNHRADLAFPCATENEIGEQDAYRLINHPIKLVCEAANMPCTPEAVTLLTGKNILFGPGKAANAGGVAVSGLELVQNSMRLSWQGEEIDARLKLLMKGIHRACLEAAEAYGRPGDLLNGANLAAFEKVAHAMLDQGVV